MTHVALGLKRYEKCHVKLIININKFLFKKLKLWKYSQINRTKNAFLQSNNKFWTLILELFRF